MSTRSSVCLSIYLSICLQIIGSLCFSICPPFHFLCMIYPDPPFFYVTIFSELHSLIRCIFCVRLGSQRCRVGRIEDRASLSAARKSNQHCQGGRAVTN